MKNALIVCFARRMLVRSSTLYHNEWREVSISESRLNKALSYTLIILTSIHSRDARFRPRRTSSRASCPCPRPLASTMVRASVSGVWCRLTINIYYCLVSKNKARVLMTTRLKQNFFIWEEERKKMCLRSAFSCLYPPLTPFASSDHSFRNVFVLSVR